MAANDRDKEESEHVETIGRTSEEPAKVRRIQERSTTDLVAGLRELLPVASWNGDFERSLAQIKSLFHELDIKMSNGAGMPEQWVYHFAPDFEDYRDIH